MAKADAYLKSVEVDIANIEKYLKSPEELNEWELFYKSIMPYEFYILSLGCALIVFSGCFIVLIFYHFFRWRERRRQIKKYGRLL